MEYRYPSSVGPVFDEIEVKTMGETVLVAHLNMLSAKWKAQYEKDSENIPELLWRLDENGELWLDAIKICLGGDIGGKDSHAAYWDRLILSTYYGYMEIQFAFPAGKKAYISEVIYHRVLEDLRNEAGNV